MLRFLELTGMYDVVWHHSNVTTKRLHLVHACLTDDTKCVPPSESGPAEARFHLEIPDPTAGNDIDKAALEDSADR